MCDRSEKAEKPCGAVNCPGHKNNPKRALARQKGAPVGTCASWDAPDKDGRCAVSTRKDQPCVYATCPAHKDHPAAAPAA
jgi:hypothetical protein